MKTIKVLGSGCANCKTTIARIEQVAKEQGVEITLEKVQDIGEIMAYGVMSTPSVMVDGKVVHVGSVPDKNKIISWL